MALKSKEWFYKNCLREVKMHGQFSHLCWSVLEKGIGQSDSTRGHVTQAIGVAQQFLDAYPNLVAVIKAANPTLPYDVAQNAQVKRALKTWLATKSGAFGRAAFGFNYDTFRNIVTPNLGGTRRGGGGADDEFKRALRLVAEFI